MPFYQPIHTKKFMQNVRGRKKYPTSTFPKKKTQCELRGKSKMVGPLGFPTHARAVRNNTQLLLTS